MISQYYALAMEENGRYGIIDFGNEGIDFFKTLKQAQKARKKEPELEDADIVKITILRR